MSPAWEAGLIKPEELQLTERLEELQRHDYAVRGMFIANTLALVEQVVGSDAKERLERDLGLDPAWQRPMRKAPLVAFAELRVHAARLLREWAGSTEDAVAELGGGSVDIFFDSVAGRTMKLLAGSEPHRLLSAAPNGYPLAVADEATRSYTRTGERTGDFFFEQDWLGPCHHYGVFRAAVKQACSEVLEVRIEQERVDKFAFHLSW